jgi:hypothetical protein
MTTNFVDPSGMSPFAKKRRQSHPSSCRLLADFVVEVGDFDHPGFAGNGTRIADPMEASSLVYRRRPSLGEGPLDCRWRSNNQLCKPTKVLRNSGERKLVLRTARAAEPQSPKSQNALKVSK